ncbi:hypothetical protein [Rubinisphaera margarita]|uniref:hypothetical protein n=1 Tax=Rubinisphaera margarita TaxID=2909586 RepID=UPI001EE93168|nr:hypothetical protein [Rubinisphaera margarita]MCG6157725.1 hypothetical protein [Rubinisphaera margarita]
MVDDTPGSRLWVASAGYGLISMGTPLKPYSATFSANHPDSVVRNATSEGETPIARQWWEAISGLSDLQYGGPRTIAELAGLSPNQPLLIVASETYLLALRNDVESALSQLNDPELLSIFSAGCKSFGDLSNHLIPYDARMQNVVGGALRSLNIRVAQKAILERRKSQATCSAFRQSITRLTRQLPELKRFHRLAMTDVQLKAYIEKEIAKTPSCSHTRLLRQLRDQGHACEQKRFAALFRDVQEHENGS